MSACPVYICVHSETVGGTVAMAFMNITPDVRETGYMQVYAVSPDSATVRLQVKLLFIALSILL